MTSSLLRRYQGTARNRLSNKEEPGDAAATLEHGRQAIVGLMMAKKGTVHKTTSMADLS